MCVEKLNRMHKKIAQESGNSATFNVGPFLTLGLTPSDKSKPGESEFPIVAHSDLVNLRFMY